MSGYCSNCSAPLHPSAAVCSRCGRPANAAGAQPYGQPPARGPAPQQPYGAPPQHGAPQQPFGGPPQHAAPQQPGYGAPPQAGYGAPGAPFGQQPGAGAWGQPGAAPNPAPFGQPQAAAAKDDGSGMKILGGCGIAGCLGLIVAGGALLLILFVFGSSSSSSGGSSGGPSAAPSSGALRDLVKQQIGPFRLTEVAGRPTNMPADLIAGATDSLALNYAGMGGQIGHVMFAFPSSATSTARLGLFRCSVTSKEVKNQEGKRIGSLCVNRSSDGSHLAVWTNGSLLFVAAGPANLTAEFYNNVPY